ncbi:MAG: alpha/beta fold hydrolase [Solirubrobacteraceae bacterium]
MLTWSRGFTINYESAGTGPPVVLVPGTLSSAAQWELFGYTRALAIDARVVAVDPLGHGLSDKPHAPDAYAAEGVIADLLAVLDAADIEQATVWGYSRGGWIAYGLAAAHPERVTRLVVGGFGAHAHAAELSLQSAWFEHLSRADWSGFWRTFGIEDSALLRPVEEANDPLAIAAAVAGSQRPTRAVDLAAVSCPTFHYVGAQDWIAEYVAADAEALGAPVKFLPGAQHLEAFAQAVPALAAVTPWLRGSP